MIFHILPVLSLAVIINIPKFLECEVSSHSNFSPFLVDFFFRSSTMLMRKKTWRRVTFQWQSWGWMNTMFSTIRIWPGQEQQRDNQKVGLTLQLSDWYFWAWLRSLCWHFWMCESTPPYRATPTSDRGPTQSSSSSSSPSSSSASCPGLLSCKHFLILMSQDRGHWLGHIFDIIWLHHMTQTQATWHDKNDHF